MKVLITGAAGQIGQALIASAPSEFEIVGTTRAELDIADARAVDAFIAAESPALIINAAAYTAVDQAESEPDVARSINVTGPGNLARAAAAVNARMLHVSTDFVFDGTSSTPYTPDAPASPLGAYGESKRDGELAVLNQLPDRGLVLRTAWVYASSGRNFMLTMLRLMREHGKVRVVADQIGSPTTADSVASTLWALAANDELHGIYHWTDAGVASWFDFAYAIAEEAQAAGLLEHEVIVEPIVTEDNPTPANRPHFSVLDCRATINAINRAPQHWRVSLRRIIGEVNSV